MLKTTTTEHTKHVTFAAPTKLTDRCLVDRFNASGDQRYFGLIYLRYHKKVWQCCMGIVRDPDRADDLTQDVMLTVVHQISHLRNGDLLSFWIYRIARHAALAEVKSQGRRRTECLTENLNLTNEQDEARYGRDLEVRLAMVPRALLGLKEKDREIIELKYLNNFSVGDLQRHTGLSTSAVKMRLLRARQQLLVFYRRELQLSQVGAQGMR